MKKSLIALAVASAFAAPAFAATSNVDIYGVMSYSVDRVNTDDSTIDDTDLVTGRDNVSRIGFKGSEDLGGGLSAIWQIESQLSTGGGTLASRNTFVGLSSKSMGTLILGQHDTPYKLATGALDPFADTVGDYNAIIGRSSGTGAGNLFDVRANQTVAYVSPSFTGFSFAAAYIQTKTIEAAAADDTSAWSLMGKYENGPIFASLAYESHKNMAGATTTDAIKAWKAGLGYKFGNTKLGGVYEKISGGDAGAGVEVDARNAYYVSLAHAMGNITLKGAYGRAGDSDASATANDGAKFYALGADYSLSKRTTVFGVYTKLDNDGVDVTGGGYDLTPYTSGTEGVAPSAFSVGVKHTF
jgi:predicted porin